MSERIYDVKKTKYATTGSGACETKHRIRIGRIIGKTGIPRSILVGIDPQVRKGEEEGFWVGATLGIAAFFQDTGFSWGRFGQSKHKAKITIKLIKPDGTITDIAIDDALAGSSGDDGWNYAEYQISDAGRYEISVRNLATGDCEGGSKQFYNITKEYDITQAEIDERNEYDYGEDSSGGTEAEREAQSIEMILTAVAVVAIPLALYYAIKS